MPGAVRCKQIRNSEGEFQPETRVRSQYLIADSYKTAPMYGKLSWDYLHAYCPYMKFQSQNVRLKEPGESADLTLVVLNEGRYSFNYRFLQTFHWRQDLFIFPNTKIELN